MKRANAERRKGKLAAGIVPLLGRAVVLTGSGKGAQQAGTADATEAAAAQIVDGGVGARPVAPGSFDNIFSLADVGEQDTIVLRGVDAYHSVYFSTPMTQVVKTATLKLRYHFSPGLIPALSHFKVSLNGTLVATLAVHTP